MCLRYRAAMAGEVLPPGCLRSSRVSRGVHGVVLVTVVGLFGGIRSPVSRSPVDRRAAMASSREAGRARRTGEEGGFAGPARPGWAEQKGREGGRAGAQVGRERARVHLGRARGGEE
jgi:hypothetical protein